MTGVVSVSIDEAGSGRAQLHYYGGFTQEVSSPFFVYDKEGNLTLDYHEGSEVEKDLSDVVSEMIRSGETEWRSDDPRFDGDITTPLKEKV